MTELGKMLVGLGLIVTLLGAVLWWWPGKITGRFLPGDILYEKDGARFYFPIVTCLVVSAILTLLSWLIRRH